MRLHQMHRALPATALLALWLTVFPGLVWAAPSSEAGSSPRKETVRKYFDGCRGKSGKDAACDKLRKDAVEILKDNLMTLGSTADRAYLPDIAGMFRSEEVDLRIAAADAIGMIGPQDQDVDMMTPLANDPVPDVRRAVGQMISRGKGNALALLSERTTPMRIGRTPEKPTDAAKFGLPVMPDSTYLFDSSDTLVGRLSYVTKGKSDPAQFYKGKAKKGPFPLPEFKEKYRYQIQDEDEAMSLVQEAAGKEMNKMQPPDPTNVEAYTAFMEKITSMGARQGSRMNLDSYQPNLFASPTVYILDERQIGQRSYPTRYVVLYQDQALRKPGYRLSWMTVPDNAIKTAQAVSLAEEKEELARKKENEALKKRQETLQNLEKKKDEQEKKQFKKGQADLEKELGF
ncbi:MAG TPA: HEAT repeat domain-containing protein [Nitrospiraceae bacterium]|nr:HEAT repeat domain-containing protein [Nitrospiraceae bacterium]